MEFRRLGNSGLRISEIAYGNWLTHGSQVEEDAALACVRQALDEGITTFDTADVYANTAAETVLGKALAGERREGLEIFTKVYFPTNAGGHNDHGLSRKHILESIDASLSRLGTDYVDLYQAHRYDHDTPLEETMEAFADVVRQGKALYIGVSEWRAEELRAAHDLARELRVPLVSNQPQYNLLWRVIESEVVPTSVELGIGQVVWSPIAQGVLTGKYRPGADLPEGSRATDDKGGADMISRWMKDDVLERVQRLQADRRRPGAEPGPARRRVGAAERQRLRRDHRRQPARAGHRQRQGRRRPPRGRRAQRHRRDRRPDRRARPRQDPVPAADRHLRLRSPRVTGSRASVEVQR